MKTSSILVSLLLVVLFAIPSTASAGAASASAVQPQTPAPKPSILAIVPTTVPPGMLNVPGQDIRVTYSDKDQNEVTVAINPLNPANIIEGANDYRGWDGTGAAGSWCGIYTSFDSGGHWNMGLVPHSGALSWSSSAGDPSAAFDLMGNAYFTCLGFVRAGPFITNNTIAVTKSTDGGMTWLPPVNVVSTASTPPFHDKPYMAVDTSIGSPHKNNIYVSWTNFSSLSGGASPIYFSRSVNGGASFSTPMKISGTQSYCQGSQPSVGPAGEVYVSFISYSGSQSRLYVTRSDDGGVTFNTPVFVSNVVDPGDLPEYYRTPTIPSSATDHSSGQFSGSIYVVWQDGRNGHSDIFVSYSRDRGVTWSAAKKVNDDATTNAQFFPFVSVAPTGRVDVVFYDRRLDPNDILLDVYAGVSSNGGATFKNRRITDRPIVARSGQPFIGDYIGVASLDWSFYPGWCGFVGSDEEIFTEQSPILHIVLVPR